jgi:hypothetical protein
MREQIIGVQEQERCASASVVGLLLQVSPLRHDAQALWNEQTTWFRFHRLCVEHVADVIDVKLDCRPARTAAV